MPSVGRYVERHIGRVSADISTDTSVECPSIYRPIHRSRGAQNTHVLRSLVAPFKYNSAFASFELLVFEFPFETMHVFYEPQCGRIWRSISAKNQSCNAATSNFAHRHRSLSCKHSYSRQSISNLTTQCR